MNVTDEIAKHLRELYLGGNWTGVSLKEKLADVTFRQAITKIGDFHNIATLVFHINYYVRAVTRVLEGGPLVTHDKFSLTLSPITTANEWEKLRDDAFSVAEKLAGLIEKLPENTLWNDLAAKKHGNCY